MTTTELASARGVANRYIELVSAGDLEGVAALFRPDATLIHPLGRFAGRRAIRTYYAEHILPQGFQLVAVSFLDDERCCAFELEATSPGSLTHAIDHLTVDAHGRIQRLAIYYR